MHLVLPGQNGETEKVIKYSLEFMTSDIINQFSQGKKGERVKYENNKTMQKSYQNGYSKYCWNEKLSLEIEDIKKDKPQKI